MSDVIIKVEGLSKKYLLNHQQIRGHSSFRETLMSGVHMAEQAVTNMFRKEPLLPPTQEEFWALKDVSFNICSGDRLGIIGRNGAGKSTLLKILSRIVEPTKGRISICGRVASLLEVGTGFHPELTGRENIFLNGAILGMSRVEIKRNFDEIVAFAEVEKFLDTPVKRYSSGMYVRLAFAVAAHLDPEILIVDEVLAVGDARFQKKCLGKMQEVGTGGRTVLFVSHSMSMINALCTKGLWLDNGRISNHGNIYDVTSAYTKAQSDENSSLLHATRTGSGEVRLVELIVHDKILQSPCSLNLSFTLEVSQLSKGINIGFSIHKDNSEVMMIAYSGPKNIFDLTKGTHRLSATIDTLPLTPGIYFIRARIESNGAEVDWPRGDLANFEIRFKDSELLGCRPETIESGRLFSTVNWKQFEKDEHDNDTQRK